MPAAIPETVKSKVISQWLRGLSKDTIAQDNNISAGAVSNITNEWSIALGKPEADAFRELAKTLTIAGITPAQCAIGFRTMTLLSEQNIDEDVAAQLIIETYKKCKEFDITSSKFATCIKELVKVSDDHRIPLLKVEEYINEKLAKKKELENELENLKSEISTFKNQKSEIENALDLALQQKKMADLEIKSYTNAKQVLDRHNISINEDLPKFANIINRIKAYGYDSKRLIAELKDIQYLGGKKRALEIATKELEESIAKLRQHESILQDKIFLHSETLPVYDELATLGFGSNELIMLRNLIVNIANSRDEYPPMAVKNSLKT
jgi:predicted  nucleic acid-binding Zn-ribbon protein